MSGAKAKTAPVPSLEERAKALAADLRVARDESVAREQALLAQAVRAAEDVVSAIRSSKRSV